MSEVDIHTEADGPLVASFTWWSGGRGNHSFNDKMIERISRIDGILYAEFQIGWDYGASAPNIVLIPVATLIRDYSRTG